MVHDDSVMILLADALTAGERKLAESGRADRVREVRHDFQKLMRDDLVALVEGATDRKVIALMSDSHIDPDMAVEVFALEPLREQSR